jgi:serine protease AprX
MRAKKSVTIILTLLLLVSSVSAGLTVTQSNGIAQTGTNGISFINTSGIAVTGADGLLSFNPNGIAVTGADGIAVTGADGLTYLGANGIAVTGADGIAVTGADGIAVTGADGIAVTGADGQTYNVNSLLLRNPNGIAVTGADGIAVTGADGIAVTGADALNLLRADGIAVTGADGIAVTGADGIAVTGADGQTFSINPVGIAVTGADSIIFTLANDVGITGAQNIRILSEDGLISAGNGSGLQSVDPELALLLNQLTDDSNVNAVVVYHQLPTEADLNELRNLGVLGGVRYRSLPMIAMTATKRQLINISHLPTVRSIYGNRTLPLLSSDPYMAMNCAGRIPSDQNLTQQNQGLSVLGRNVTVAVLDTGVDGTHADLSGRVVQNVKLLDTQGISVGFMNPINLENWPNTDQLAGHGTFVAGIIAGSGACSNGRYTGLAPGVNVLGLSAGDLTLSFVLSGFDNLMTKGSNYNFRVVNCSFSANTVFDLNDPVNVATKLLTERGINVVFSAGNTGPGANSLNPYAVAPWVIGVGATDERGRLADISSRGAFGNALFHPTLVAPGVSLISLRTLGTTGIIGLLQADRQRLSLADLSSYTTASGTSFSAPQVAATIALMLEVNPALTPAQIRDILQRTATPLANYAYHEVGAGMLNAHAAVIEAAFPEKRLGAWRATLDKKVVSFTNEPVRQFSGTVYPFNTAETTISVPQDTFQAVVQVAWGPITSLNDLSLTLIDPRGNQYRVNQLNLLGLTGKRERLVLKQPMAGNWRVRVSNSLLALSSQPFTGTVEVTRTQLAQVNDLGSLSSSLRAEIYQAMRTRVMTPYGQNFRPAFAVTRAALAESLVYGARLPQYLAPEPRYTDVQNVTTRSFVESAQFSSSTALFPDDSSNRFRPDENTDRLTAAIVLIRAAGLRSEAESQSGSSSGIADILTVPSALRGYVTVAVSRGLLTTSSSLFRPQNSLTRGELAHALAALQRMAVE